MFINWTVTERLDPNSLQASADGTSTHGIPAPSYGNYGGWNFSAGVEGGTPPEGPNPTPAPVDALDTLFWQKDLVYQHVQDGVVAPQDIPTVIAQADVTLVEGMYALTNTTNLDPEALLYDAFATIGMVGKILTTPSELTYLEAHPIDAGIVITAAQAAIPNFQLGLTETRGEARSLNGAFHVFEAHFAQQFAQAIASFGAPGAVESLNTKSLAADTSQQSWLAVPEHAPWHALAGGP